MTAMGHVTCGVVAGVARRPRRLPTYGTAAHGSPGVQSGNPVHSPTEVVTGRRDTVIGATSRGPGPEPVAGQNQGVIASRRSGAPGAAPARSGAAHHLAQLEHVLDQFQLGPDEEHVLHL